MTAKVEYTPKINVAFFCVWGESRKVSLNPGVSNQLHV
jgi:hypothetical protein